jgi:hypothetical protein
MTLLPPGVKVHLAFGYTECARASKGLPCWSRACCGMKPWLETELARIPGRSALAEAIR